MPRPGTSVAIHALAGTAGALAGAMGSFLQAASRTVGSVPVPYGLVAALLSSGAVFVGAGLLAAGRSAALAAALGWAAIVALMLLPRSEGDLVLANTTSAYVWLYGGALLAGLCVLLPYRLLGRRLRRDRSSVQGA